MEAPTSAGHTRQRGDARAAEISRMAWDVTKHCIIFHLHQLFHLIFTLHSSGVLREDAIWGRGALDDKASLMAIMESLEAMLQLRVQPTRGFYLAFSHDQEVNGDGAIEMVRILKRR